MQKDAGLQGTDRLVRLLEIVATEPGTLTSIAKRAQLSDATALRYLGSLVAHGLLERDPTTRTYRIGMRLFALGRAALGGRDFMGLAGSCMTTLVDRTGETANLGARADDDVLVVHAVESPHPIRKGVTIGERDYWHSSGLGKAILSTLPADAVEEILARHSFTRTTPRTITSATALLRELEGVRQKGFAVDDEESADGLRCVAVPVRDHSSTARYALSISGPASRIGRERFAAIGAELRKQAELLEAFLDFDPTHEPTHEPTHGPTATTKGNHR